MAPTLESIRVVHEGRSGYVEIEGERYPIELGEGGGFSIHVRSIRDRAKRAAHRAVLEALVASEPTKWALESRRRLTSSRVR